MHKDILYEELKEYQERVYPAWQKEDLETKDQMLLFQIYYCVSAIFLAQEKILNSTKDHTDGAWFRQNITWIASVISCLLLGYISYNI